MRDGGSLFCTGERRHTYDIAKEGYVNLLPPGRAKNSHTGDDAEMVRAREEFLSGGGYDRYSREAAALAAEVIIERAKCRAQNAESQPKTPIIKAGRLAQQDDVVGSLEDSTEVVPMMISSSTVNTVPLPLKGKAQDAPVVSSEIDGEGRLAQQDDVVGPLDASDEVVPCFAPGLSPVPCFAPPCYGVDAGCGEGRHTVNMAKTLAEMLGVPVTTVGFDASKFGVRAAAKRYVKNSANTPEGVTPMFAAANIFSLPVADECADVFTSLFAPLPDDEVRRVLKKGGVLVICAAGAEHLSEMRRVLYENPVPSGGGAAVPDGFTTAREKIIEYRIDLSSNEEIMSLFTMTPFYYNAPAEGRKKLEALSSLTVTVQVKCTVAVKD